MHLRIENIAPFLPWGRRYRRNHLKADLAAGLTVAVVAVPQSMAYALIAGLPVQYGLYASILPTLVGCLWGSSAHLISGPTTALSLVVFSALQNLAPPGSAAYIELAFFLAILVGGIQIAMGMARFGALLNFVSHSVILGFTAGAAVLIGFKQLPGLLGLKLEKGGLFFESVIDIAAHLHQSHWPTLMLGVVTIVVIVGIKLYRPAWPGTLVAMILTGTVVALFDLDQKGVAVVGSIPGHLPPFHIPGPVVGTRVGSLASGALAIAILGLVEAISISKAIAGQTHQRLDINQVFIGQGLANLTAGVFGGYAVSGSFTRSAVNFRSGAKTPVSGVISAAAVAAVVLLAAPLAANLPLAALAGVLIVVAFEMVRKEDIKRTIRATRSDAAVLTITFISTLMLNIEFAVYVGVLLSIGLHLANTSHPRIHSVVPDLETGKMAGSAHGRTCCQMDMLHIQGSLFFGSATFVQEELQRRLRHHPYVNSLLLRLHRVNTLDASGIHTLEIILEEVRRRGGGMFLAGGNHRVFLVLKNSGLLREIGERHLRKGTGKAIRQAMREYFCPMVCAACEYAVFNECPDLKKGNWEILGPGASPRQCVLPEWTAHKRKPETAGRTTTEVVDE